jgi:stage V sporulation protein G
MKITEVRIKLMENSDDRLRAFCSITFDDCFVVRDLKIIEGTNGPFVAMPSRKLTGHCPHCGAKNHLRASHCNQCGKRLEDSRAIRDPEGRVKLYADIAHPINSECREAIQNRVIAEYTEELRRSEQPGYVSRYDDSYGEDDIDDYDSLEDTPARGREPRAAVTRHIQPAESTPPPPHSIPSGSAVSEPSRSRRAGWLRRRHLRLIQGVAGELGRAKRNE